MGMRFEWRDEYEMGDEEIDRQHRQIFELGNRILEATAYDEALKADLVNLYAHTRTHFQAEEARLRAQRDPGYLTHRDQHDGLLTRLTEVTERLRADPTGLTDLKAFIAEWVMRHVLEQDRSHRHPPA